MLWSSVSDWLVPLAIILLGVVDLAQNGNWSSEGGTVTFPGPTAVHAIFLLLVCVPLYWRKSHPVFVGVAVPVVCVTWVLSMFNLAEQPPFEPGLAVVVALFALGSRAGGRRGGIAAVFALSLMLAVEVAGGIAGQGVGNAFPAILLFTLSWVLGRIVYHYSHLASSQQDRADRLEREQGIRARQAAELERARIARELHDVIAHSLSMIVVQAAAERRALAAGQGSPEAVLESIENAGRQTMAELRRLLGVQRKGDRGLSLAPPPGLGQLRDLVNELANSGIDVNLSTAGAARLPSGVDLSAYRIVQECLTNVVKHAGATHVDIQVVCQDRSIEIEVADNGRSASRSSGDAGFGLIGIRERAAVYDGEVVAGPLDGGGYRVRTVLRFDAGERASV